MKALIVTRPKDQETVLCQQLMLLGNPVFHLPIISIKPLKRQLPNTVANWIFISVNAVKFTAQNSTEAEWQSILNQTLYAIGESTKAALEHHGAKDVKVPNGSNSEALLALASLQGPLDQRIIIACGIGGRTLIESELTLRGAEVERYESYQREPCEQKILLNFLTDNSVPNEAVWLISSEQSMRYLDSQIEQSLNCVVTSKRLYDIAVELTNIKAIAISASAQTTDIVRCIEKLNSKAFK